MPVDFEIYKPPDCIMRRWTPMATDCYKIGCRCSICKIPLFIESKCRMKNAVLELVRKFGKPITKRGDIIDDNF